MIFVRSENIKSNNWSGNIAWGYCGVGGTFGHLAIVIMVFYGVYAAHIGMGFWRLARKLSEVKTFLLRCLAAVCVMAGISAIFNGLALVFALLLV
ncbi:hypothetical protein [Pectobacterium parmentieri]|uniref:Uncharacterized protein n=1 Tax=Pectobacterium parmentieri TaxID=1905730 RepID=A0A8B3FCR9_PECPM|nr:hypothetical protein [Pectobacterium parmentieri]AOR58853.1 hypothetical protein A8F97_08030 [Pectobacterium parmentieri]AYH10111.1 hypothetical protein C5E24_10670 [Pectobacterium parmentieri]AYH19178.1 hypothetical protein C5E22_12120 [Pectobacterium parmentieri]AYH36430.1 hypothetical protein C5E17_10615 [Pectobacterium parmentieri]AZS56536.1 hypothetical protein C5E18_10615 [Pectobacterium parmentieri]